MFAIVLASGLTLGVVLTGCSSGPQPVNCVAGRAQTSHCPGDAGGCVGENTVGALCDGAIYVCECVENTTGWGIYSCDCEGSI